jgi:hypothetical protein
MLEARVTARRMRIAAAMGEMGVDAVVEGEDVRASGAGLMGRWWRDLGLREAGRGQI